MVPPRADGRLAETPLLLIGGVNFAVAWVAARVNPRTGEAYPADSGYGLFACMGIAAGQYITRYYGVAHNDAFFNNHPDTAQTHMIRRDRYGYGLDGVRVADEVHACAGFVEDATYHRGVACMTNASQEANCRFVWQRNGECYLVAIRNLLPDEQMLANYDVGYREGTPSDLHLLRVVRYRRVGHDHVYSCGFVQERWRGRAGGREWRVCYVGSVDMEWFTTDELAAMAIPADRGRVLTHYGGSAAPAPEGIRHPGAPAEPCCRATFARWMMPRFAGPPIDLDP